MSVVDVGPRTARVILSFDTQSIGVFPLLCEMGVVYAL
jgi:hypothetical protein